MRDQPHFCAFIFEPSETYLVCGLPQSRQPDASIQRAQSLLRDDPVDAVSRVSVLWGFQTVVLSNDVQGRNGFNIGRRSAWDRRAGASTYGSERECS
jgi:hypothetical protein